MLNLYRRAYYVWRRFRDALAEDSMDRLVRDLVPSSVKWYGKLAVVERLMERHLASRYSFLERFYVLLPEY